jgi:hypothetical protein
MKQLMLTLAIIGATGAAASAATLGVYPGATKLPTQMRDAIPFCGTKMVTVVYRVPDVNAQVVAAWYKSHIAGGITITIPKVNETVLGSRARPKVLVPIARVSES